MMRLHVALLAAVLALAGTVMAVVLVEGSGPIPVASSQEPDDEPANGDDTAGDDEPAGDDADVGNSTTVVLPGLTRDRPRVTEYIVRDGDTLASIAELYG